MSDNFNDSLDTGMEVEDSKKAEYNARVRETRKQNLAVWKAAFDEAEKETGGAIKEQLSTRSNDIEVTNALTFGEPKYIVRKTDNGDVKEPVPNIVGYKVKNVSNEPIACYTTKCDLVDGVYVKTPVAITIEPGQTADLRKVDFVTLLSAPEFSFTAANGKLTTRRYTGSNAEDLETFLEKHNFLPTNCKVGDMIIGISTNIDGADVIIPQYKDVFAYLENKTEKKARGGKKENKEAVSAQELAANYVRRLIASPAVQQ